MGVLLVLVSGVWYYREVQFKRMILRDEEMQKEPAGFEDKLMADVAACLDKYKLFKIEELRKGFHAGFIIKGGCIHNQLYAIKKIKWDAYEEFNILHKL